jgi:hypothetical protein
MSLDLYLDDEWVGNYTHNVTPMWRKAGCYEALYRSDGKKAKDVLPQLVDGYCAMFRDPQAYEALNPSNGWGCCETATKFLADVIEKFRAQPEATVRVSA